MAKSLLTTLVLLILATFSIAGLAQQTIALPTLPDNQEMLILSVELEPGQASTPHRHNAHVFVYVVAGAVEMQVRGGPLLRLEPGDTFYEAPDDIHQVSRNASSTEPATFVVHMLRTAGTAVSLPAD